MVQRLTFLVLFSFFLTNCQKGSNPTESTTSCAQSSFLQAASLSSVDFSELLKPETQRWIITFKSEATELVALLNESHLEDIEEISENSLSVALPLNVNRGELFNKIHDSVDVESIEADSIVVANDDVVSSERASTQWHHQRVQTFDLWEFSQGDPTVTVAVIDSGVDISHPDLKNQMWRNPKEIKNGRDDDGNGLIDDLNGWNYVDKRGNPSPTSSAKGGYHGTHVAGIIAGAESTLGYTGITPKIKIMGLRFLDNNKTGFTSNAVKAIHYAIDNGARIINLSWGSQNRNTSLMSALRRARDKGILVIAASGNMGKNNDSSPFYPASYNYSNIISVTASTKSDRLLSGINYGSKSVHIAAPGSDILSTDRYKSYYSRSGSSMAAPVVTAVAALLLSVNHDLTGSQLKSLILNGADKLSALYGKTQSGRRLNGKKSIEKLLATDPSDLPIIDETNNINADDTSLETETCEVGTI